MKKFLKMLAVCFMAFISCFTIVACDKAPEDPNTQQGETPSGGTTDQTNEANYNKMKNVASSTTPANGYTMELSMEDSTVSTADYTGFDFSSIGCTTQAQIDAFKEELDEGLEEESYTDSSKEVTAYDATTKTGYTLEYQDNELKGYSVSDSTTLYKCSISRMPSGSEEMMTASEDGEEATTPSTPTYVYDKTKYNIDDKYFNQYIYDFNAEFGEMLEEVVNNSLNEFEESLTASLDRFNIKSTPTTTVTCTETDGITTMLIKLEVANIETLDMSSMMGVQLKNVTAKVEYEFKFNSTKFLGCEGRMIINGTLAMNLAEMMPTSEDSGEGSETPATTPILNVNMSISSINKFVLGDYDGTNKPTIEAETFLGTGEENSVEDREADITLHIGDYKYRSISRTMNDNFDKANILKWADYDTNDYAQLITNLADITWYTDKECTIPYTGTKFTSYDMDLYAKMSDITLGENKAYCVSTNLRTYNSEMDYSDYFYGISIVDKNGTVPVYYPCIYVNGEQYTSGQTYTLDTTKINQIIYVYGSND